MAAHRYWRWRCSTGSQGNGNFFSCATLNFYNVATGGSDLASGNAGIASGFYAGGYEASKAFDNNNSTYYFANNAANAWFGVDFGAGNAYDLNNFNYRIEPSATISGPKDLQVEWSDDAATWTLAAAFNGLTWTANGQLQNFAVVPASAVGIRDSSTYALVAAKVAAAYARTTEADVLVALNYPTHSERVTTAGALVAALSDEPLRLSNAAVLVAVKGRTANPKLRAWTFTLDGHDFYVLKLGTMGTLVYDLYSSQWMDWDAFSQVYWPVNVGFNWVDGQGITDSSGHTFGSNVVVADDTYPLLWILEPSQPYDQSPDVLDAQQQYYFPRIIQGQLPVTGREAIPCYAVWLTTDMGAPAYVGAGVKLEISDDAGATYYDMGTVNVTPGNNTPEISWYSLGQMTAPGRLFRITDDGAVARIDSMEMNDPDDKPK